MYQKVHKLVGVMVLFFFFNDTATTEIYTLSLHDALPIWSRVNPARFRPFSMLSPSMASSSASSSFMGDVGTWPALNYTRTDAVTHRLWRRFRQPQAQQRTHKPVVTAAAVAALEQVVVEHLDAPHIAN